MTEDSIVEKMVSVRRVAATNKGGRDMSFSVVMVAGDGEGRIGLGTGNAKEVPLAMQKASQNARQDMTFIELDNATLYHEIKGHFGASEVFMKPASEGTGIIAGSAMRAVFEVMGVKNILAKCIGSTNPLNVVRATLAGLKSMSTPSMIARKRGIAVEDIWQGDKDE